VKKVSDADLSSMLKAVSNLNDPIRDNVVSMIEEIRYWRWMNDVSSDLGEAEMAIDRLLWIEEATRQLRWHLHINAQAPYGTKPDMSISHNPYVRNVVVRTLTGEEE